MTDFVKTRKYLLVALFGVVQLFSVDLLQAGLVSYWAFDEASGSSAADSQGVSNGSLGGGTYEWGEGVVGNAIHLTDWASQVSIESGAAAFNGGGGDFTLTSFFKMSNAGASYSRYTAETGNTDDPYVVLTNNTSGNSTGGIFNWLSKLNSYQGRRVVTGVNGPVASDKAEIAYLIPYGDYASGVRFDDNEWHWIGLRVEDGVMSLFIDGVDTGLSATYTGGTSMTDGGVATVIGGGHDDYWIDEFKVWDTALSDTELIAEYNVPEPMTLALLGVGVLPVLFRKKK